MLRRVVETCASHVRLLGPGCKWLGVGNVAKAIICPAGYGVGTAVKSFMTTVHHDVIPVYADLHQLFGNGVGLAEFVSDQVALALETTRDDMQQDDPADRCFYGTHFALARRHRQLFLMIDNAEAIWTARGVYQDWAHGLLYQLSNTGDSTIATIVRGKTAFLDRLIDGQSSVPAYFLARSSLNHTKFPTIRIRTNTPVDRDAAVVVARNLQMPSMAELILFASGANYGKAKRMVTADFLRTAPQVIMYYIILYKLILYIISRWLRRRPTLGSSSRPFFTGTWRATLPTSLRRLVGWLVGLIGLETSILIITRQGKIPDATMIQGTIFDQTYRDQLCLLSDAGIIAMPYGPHYEIYPATALHLTAWQMIRAGTFDQFQPALESILRIK